MNVNMQCVGTSISFNQFETIFNAAGANSTISLSDANALPPANMLPLIANANTKKLALQVSGRSISAPGLIEMVNTATGANTVISIDELNNYPITSVDQIVAAIGAKPYPISINGGAVNQTTAPPLINALSNPNTPLSLNSLNSLTDEAVTIVLSAIGSKTFSISLDGSLSTPTSIIGTIGKIGENSNISLSNSRFINADAMSQILASIGTKKFSITFDAPDFTVPYLKSFIATAGPNTSITVTTSQVLTTSDLLEILTLNGDRKLTLEFNGRQLSVDPVNGDKLQQVVAAANTSHTISVNTMQYPPLTYILPIIQSSTNTNMVLSYNGSQLTDTEAQGNVVVRGIEVAQPTTSIIVTSVGVTNYSVENYLDIVRAAG
ncbi:hypothetical protein [Pseudomonas coronafaciens]|uniref:hypothetical protein n=1 Tax=Pseudomonas coronafaciens TaxID=53409 RepID=UPI0006B65746|nr:hypothetical protein [Pseudomonas coronafaciens]KPB52332.1 Uncharacterized protein AC511_1223 [Pseudomonas coronafaciens pv. oryzae]KPY07905.1 Uncharacterized protein ALO57_02063 [Pseudomonas coronafaciens pv. oryzae]RMN24361.1 hypothetical protein ALQ62_00423 [Pseudomonas coronafaciens pv. zizaniae]RMS98444.1 hypothetical protein ALP55_01410 [Pseudomonas coronafaciens pv. oryzae]RMV90550.1 hypothetical protein ALP02_03375 [Pseudomonas coronafaciens pv. garcae]